MNGSLFNSLSDLVVQHKKLKAFLKENGQEHFPSLFLENSLPKHLILFFYYRIFVFPNILDM